MGYRQGAGRRRSITRTIAPGYPVARWDNTTWRSRPGESSAEYIPPLDREQLVVLDVAAINLPGITYAQDWIMVSRFITETGSLEPVAGEWLQVFESLL